mgnify:CR=1 FL=1
MDMMEKYKKQKEEPKEEPVKRNNNGLLGSNSTESEPWNFSFKDIGIGMLVGGFLGMSLIGRPNTGNTNEQFY